MNSPDGSARRNSKHPSLYRRTPCDPSEWFSREQLAEARAYAKPLHRLKLVSSILTLAVLVAAVVTEAAPRLIDAVGIGAWPVQLAIVVVGFVAVMTIFDAPFAAYVQLVYDKRWGLSTQTPGRFVTDQLKELAISSIMLVVLFLPVYWIVRATDLWWIYGWAAFMAIQVLILVVQPVVIMPRFNKFIPVEPGELRSRIERVAELAGTTIEGVYTMDASKRSTRTNAFVAGFGPTKRVVLFDTLLSHPIENVEQVVAHEIGHYRRRHILQLVPAVGLLLLAAFALVKVVSSSEAVLDLAGIDHLGDPGSLPLFLLVLGLGFVVLQIPMAWFSRVKEREADLEALELLGNPQSFVDFWRRLVPQDKAELEPSWWRKVNGSHPQVAERMTFIRSWAQMNGVPFTMPPPVAPLKEPEPAA